MPVRILIVDDQELICEGLAALLGNVPGFEVLEDSARDGIEALELVARHGPDVVLMDIAMPRMNGIEATRQIHQRFPEIKVLVLTITETEAQAAACLKAGAHGYLMKKTNHAELEDAIRQLLAGRSYVSRHLDSERLAENMAQPGTREESRFDELTPRERQVMQLIAEGHSNKRISDILAVGVKTVETHRTNMMRKMDVHNAAEITSLAHRLGIIE